MAPDVTAAMVEASECFIPLEELQKKVGERLSVLTGAQAAFVSAGAASGVMLAGAACLTGTDVAAVEQLPDTGNRPNEFVISLVDNHTYIHQSLRICGGTLAPAGTVNGVTAGDYAAAVTDRTAALVVFLGAQSKQQLAEVIDIAHARDLPVIVDAAAQLPPRSNLTEIPAMGADLVVFSGGKGIAGPQSTGLVLGRRELVRACALNSSPNTAAGRGMKVGKEELVGLLRAVELLMEEDESSRIADWERQCRQMAKAVGTVPGVAVIYNAPFSASHPSSAPFLRLEFDGSSPLTAVTTAQALKEGEPSVIVGRTGESITVCPQTLQPGEATTVAARLVEILHAGQAH